MNNHLLNWSLFCSASKPLQVSVGFVFSLSTVLQ